MLQQCKKCKICEKVVGYVAAMRWSRPSVARCSDAGRIAIVRTSVLVLSELFFLTSTDPFRQLSAEQGKHTVLSYGFHMWYNTRFI
ncbi:hypothetical protein QQG55_48480 [Brugia pahangi]|uniref:LIM zinc-binding domain-containing protein n=1 Tax=Brugia pahangi TaxID=6280 RepID=A0A0N4TIJ2_BRUPA|nr:unnamed protein product [Brugia pahangi]